MESRQTGNRPEAVRSLPFDAWPDADKTAWAAACVKPIRLQKGGPAAHMRPITREDLARRYGYLLDFVSRTEGLDVKAPAAFYVTPERIERFLSELQHRVGSVTVYGTIYKVRRMAQLLAPTLRFDWLIEIEKDLDLLKRPQSKMDRFVYSHELVQAGLALMCEAESVSLKSRLGRARQYRNGLMVALLGFHPIRLKNFTALELQRSLKPLGSSSWIILSASETKEKRADEREIVALLLPWLQNYLDIYRPILAKGRVSQALWLSSNDGSPMTYSGVESAIYEATLQTIGKKISPHLFRTAGASTAAVYAGHQPRLATALLHHTSPEVAEEHYNRATSLSAAQSYAALIRALP